MSELTVMPVKENWRSRYRYSVYEHRMVGPGETVYSRFFIVLKNEYGVIVHFTRFHNYVGVYEGKVYRPITANAKQKLYYVCKALNYILADHYEEYGVDHVFKVTKDQLLGFFMDYALSEKPAGGFRGEQSIEKCVSAVTMFFRRLSYKFGSYVTLNKSDLYKEVTIYGKNRRSVKKYIPDFEITGIPEEKHIFRDIPNKVFKVLMEMAMRYAPDIVFAMALSAFAGLRPGEVCNVRQESSPNGRGIRFVYLNDQIISAEIDLTRECPMRSDGVVCGSIKKKRMQKVCPLFIEAFQILYERHKRYLSTVSFEKDYAPMFVNRRGMAMTYPDYYKRFCDLVKDHLRPFLLKHEDPELRIYGQLLMENSLGPHALRHWFSVQLVLNGADVARLQFFRGDRSPESAFWYLQNKGDLIDTLKQTSADLVEWLLEEGGRNG